MEDRGEVWEVLGGKGLPARRSGEGEGPPKEVNCKYTAAGGVWPRSEGGFLVLRLRSTV